MGSTHLHTLSNGTEVAVGSNWARTTLPCGTTVYAEPNADSPRMAALLGYGADVDAMTREHDLLHSRLMDWLGQPYSHGLRAAVGLEHNPTVAALEEDAVLAVQRLSCALRGLASSQGTAPAPGHPTTPQAPEGA